MYVYVGLMFLCILFCFVVCVFFLGCCNPLAPNEDIMRFRCGGGSHIPFVYIFVKLFKICIFFLIGFGDFCAVVISF